jgi:tRNA (cytidine/uridine-2'-O-)-methyltransferase
MRIALYQPDIPQNTGAIVRICACLGLPLDIIEPCGFTFTDRQMRRAAMDYAPLADVTRHTSWQTFRPTVTGRLVLLTTRADVAYTDFAFQADDTLLFGSEAAGVPEDVHRSADRRLRIPMVDGARSLNLAVAAGMVAGEALRQTRPANRR